MLIRRLGGVHTEFIRNISTIEVGRFVFMISLYRLFNIVSTIWLEKHCIKLLKTVGNIKLG